VPLLFLLFSYFLSYDSCLFLSEILSSLTHNLEVVSLEKQVMEKQLMLEKLQNDILKGVITKAHA